MDKKEKKYCSCGFVQSFPIPHEHDRTKRENEIISEHEKILNKEKDKYNTEMWEAVRERICEITIGDFKDYIPKETIRKVLDDLENHVIVEEYDSFSSKNNEYWSGFSEVITKLKKQLLGDE